MFTVLIDTSAYEAYGLSFTGPVFESLETLAVQGKVMLVNCSIIRREIEAHLQESIAAAVNQIDAATRKVDHNTKDNLGTITELLNNKGELKASILRDRLDYVTAFFDKTSVDDLDLSQVDVNGLLQDYFEKKAPFGEGKKKAEFPDAFMLNAFKHAYADNLSQTCLVSLDAGWSDFARDVPDIQMFKTIPELLDFINAKYDTVFADQLRQALEQKKDIILERIAEKIKDNGYFTFDDQWYDPESIIDPSSVTVELLDTNILTYSDMEAEWSLQLRVSYQLDVVAIDGDSWVKDSDTKKIIYLGSNTYQVNVEKVVTAEVETYYEAHAIAATLSFGHMILPHDLYDINRYDDNTEIIELTNWAEGHYD